MLWMFLGKIGQGNPLLSKIYNFLKKRLFKNLSSFKMREFFHENFAMRVVILLNYPKGRKVT